MDLSDNPMFVLEPVQLQFQVQSDIVALLVANNVLWLALESGSVYRIDLNSPEKVFHTNVFTETKSKTGKVANAFVDPRGTYLVVQTAGFEYLYLGLQSTQARPLNRWKGLRATSIAFVPESTNVLIGTTDGVYECAIDSEAAKPDRFVKHVWSGSAIQVAVARVGDGKTYIVQVLTEDSKLLAFEASIGTFHKSSASFAPAFKTSPDVTSLDKVQLCSADSERIVAVDREEVVLGRIDGFSKQKFAVDGVPKAVALTQYHVVLLYDGEIRFYNQLNGKEVSTLQVPRQRGERLLGLSADHSSNTYWLYTNLNIYEIVVGDEAADIWLILYEQKKYDEALSLLKPTDMANRSKVLKSKSDDLFASHKYIEAAKTYAETDAPFETVSLKLLETDTAGLRAYLIAKLSQLPKSNYMQRVMVSSWIVELFIERLNDLDNEIASNKNSNLANNILESASREATPDAEATQQLEQVQREYRSFLQKYKSYLDKDTVYQIILSHNRKEELVFYSNLIDDYEVVLKFYITLQKWDDALAVIAKQNDPVLVYRFATVLLINNPSRTVETWKRLIDSLDIKKLLPSILTYNSSVNTRVLPEHNHALKFLRFYIDTQKCKDTVVHNTLLSVLITYPQQSENIVLKYLEQHSPRTDSFGRGSGSQILFDPDFILRLCFRYNKIQSAIFVYTMLEDYENAVKLALENDLIEVSIYVADKPMDSSKLRKKLWLKIAEKLISKIAMDDTFVNQRDEALKLIERNEGEPNKIKDVLRFLLGKCDLLTIKDLLPLFPDFVVIDNFKQEVVSFLEQNSQELARISQEMEESLRTSDKIKAQIKHFTNTRFQIVEPAESCAICHKILITRKFFIFPCNHSFHQDCLVRSILESNEYKLKNKIYVLQKKLKQEKSDELRQEIDEALTTKCCLCSDIKINSIEEPFAQKDSSWDL